MAKNLYAKLTFENLKKQRKIYFPYILTCIISVAMFYIITSLANNKDIGNMSGGGTLIAFLLIGSFITGLFAFVFLFYTHSFILKRRNKEFGLYNIFVMEKRHIGVVLLYETLFIGVASLVIGMLLGMALDKLMYLAVARILDASYGLGFYFSWKAIVATTVLFVCIFVCIYLYAFIRVQSSEPIELLKSESFGEKEPKTKWILALVGAVTLITGYALSIITGNANVINIMNIFAAVILVIIGTYFLFSAGSIALLKLLKKNKKYYYQTSHFIGVSGMMYRMKQNAVGLANICILATMLLVTISTTTSFMIGRDDMLIKQYPYDILINTLADEVRQKEMIEDIQTLAKEQNFDVSGEIGLNYLSFNAQIQGNDFLFPEKPSANLSNMCNLIFTTEHSYSAITGETLSLKSNEVAIMANNMRFDSAAFSLLGTKYFVKKEIDSFVSEMVFSSAILSAMGSLNIVVSDDTVLNNIYLAQKDLFGEGASDIYSIYAFNLSGEDADKIAFYAQANAIVLSGGSDGRVTCRADKAADFMSLYGGLFFLGIFLGTLFLMATILIIYYKQISEGMEDKKRFEIMQKVGMDYQQIKHSIRSQILTVFFLPLITAGMHVAFAFPIFNVMLSKLNLTNTGLFAACTVGCFVAFSIIYIAVYLLTAKVYFRIAKSSKE